MNKTFLGIAIAAILTFSVPQSVDAGHRRFTRVSPRVINNYRRDVRQVQRQSTRSFNQLDPNFNRCIRRSPVRFTPRSSGVYLRGRRGSVFFRFQ